MDGLLVGCLLVWGWLVDCSCMGISYWLVGSTIIITD